MQTVELPIDFESEAKNNGYKSNGHATNGHESNGHAGNGFVRGSKSEGYDAEPGAMAAAFAHLESAKDENGGNSEGGSDLLDAGATHEDAEELAHEKAQAQMKQINELLTKHTSTEAERIEKLRQLDMLFEDIDVSQLSERDRRLVEYNHPYGKKELMELELKNAQEPVQAVTETAHETASVAPVGEEASESKKIAPHEVMAQVEHLMDLAGTPDQLNTEKMREELDKLQGMLTDPATKAELLPSELTTINNFLAHGEDMVREAEKKASALSSATGSDKAPMEQAHVKDTAVVVDRAAQSPEGHPNIEESLERLAEVDRFVEGQQHIFDTLKELWQKSTEDIKSVEGYSQLINRRTATDSPEYVRAVTEVKRIEESKKEFINTFNTSSEDFTKLQSERQELMQFKNALNRERGSFSAEQIAAFDLAGKKILSLAQKEVQLSIELQRAEAAIQLLERRVSDFNAAIEEIESKNKVENSERKADATPAEAVGTAPNAATSTAEADAGQSNPEVRGGDENKLLDGLVEASASILILEGKAKKLSENQVRQLGYMSGLADIAAEQSENVEFQKKVKRALDEAVGLEDQYEHLDREFGAWTKDYDNFLAPKAQPDESPAGRALAETLSEFRIRKGHAIASFNSAEILDEQLKNASERLFKLVPAVGATAAAAQAPEKIAPPPVTLPTFASVDAAENITPPPVTFPERIAKPANGTEASAVISPELVAQNEKRKSNLAMDIERRKGQILAIVGTMPRDVVEKEYSRYGSEEELNAEVVRLTWQVMERKDEIAKIKQDVAGADDEFAWKTLVKQELDNIKARLAEAAGIKDVDAFIAKANIPIPKLPITFPEGGSAPSPAKATYPELKSATNAGSQEADASIPALPITLPKKVAPPSPVVTLPEPKKVDAQSVLQKVAESKVVTPENAIVIDEAYIEGFHKHDGEIGEAIRLLSEQAKDLRREFEDLRDSIPTVDGRLKISAEAYNRLSAMREKIATFMDQAASLEKEVSVHSGVHQALEADNKQRGVMINPRAQREMAEWQDHLDLQKEYAWELAHRARSLNEEFIGLTERPPGWKARYDENRAIHEKERQDWHDLRELKQRARRADGYKEGLSHLGVEMGKALVEVNRALDRQRQAVRDEVLAMKDEVVAIGLDYASLPSLVASNFMESVGTGTEMTAAKVADIYGRFKSRLDAVRSRRADGLANWQNRSQARRDQAEALRAAYRQSNSGESK